MHGAYTGAQFMTFKLVQKTMQNHHKNEDKNNIEKERFPASLPMECPGGEVYPDIKGGTSWHPARSVRIATGRLWNILF